MYNVWFKTYVKRMVLNPCVQRTFYNVRFTYVLCTVNVRCTFCCVQGPPWGPGGWVENVSSVSPACRKRRLIGAVCRNHRIKRLVPCRCLDGHVKEPYEMSMARRSNYFFSPPAHLCAVTCMTEISLIVTLNNQFTSPRTRDFVTIALKILQYFAIR